MQQILQFRLFELSSSISALQGIELFQDIISADGTTQEKT
jgi:hypothetical protein